MVEKRVMKVEYLKNPFWFDKKKNGASVKQVQDTEDIIGLAFPVEYRNALMIRNGGVSNYPTFSAHGVTIPVLPFFSVEEVAFSRRQFPLESDGCAIIVVASGAHGFLGLKYQGNGEPAVVYQDDEDAEIEFVAENFEQFLDGLSEDS